MQINVTGRHMEITEALRAHAQAKIEQEFAGFERLGHIHVILTIEKYRHIAEVVINAPHHIEIEARHESDDMYVSIDGAVDKAAKQLRKQWDKLSQRKAREGLGELEAQTRAVEESGDSGL